MSQFIDSIEGIGPAYAKKLQAVGIKSVESLLKVGSQKIGRRELAEKTGLSESLILDWVNMADLFRVKGVGGQFAELLKHSGVDTVKELATRNPENLHHALTLKNAEKHLTKVVPSPERLAEFVQQAKSLSQKVYH